MAENLGISKASFNAIETGKTGFTIERWISWCATLHVSPSDVLRKWEKSEEFANIDETRRRAYYAIVDQMIKYGFGVELDTFMRHFNVLVQQEKRMRRMEKSKKLIRDLHPRKSGR